MNLVEALKQELKTMPLLREAEDWSEEALEEYLDKRDSEAFETQWMQAFEAIQRPEEETTLDTATIDEIRKTVFLKAFDVTGSGELAGYISDDFELIAKGLHFEYSSDFLTSMYHRYKEGQLPK